jgi:NitT/TauT family transport system permease protein
MSTAPVTGTALIAKPRQERPTTPLFARPRFLQVVSVIAGLAVWQLVGAYVVTNPLYFVPLSDALRVIWDMAGTGELWHHTSTTAVEFTVGFSLAAVAGIAFGLVNGTSRIARTITDPWVSALYATPLVALMPLYLIIFGIGMTGKAALVVTVAIFPVMINTTVGVLSTDAALIDVGRAYGAGRWESFHKIYLPAALPHIVSGLRLGVGRALTGVVVGEFFFANAGLGFLIARSGQSFDTPTLFAAIIVLTVAAVVMTSVLRAAESWLAPYREAA